MRHSMKTTQQWLPTGWAGGGLIGLVALLGACKDQAPPVCAISDIQITPSVASLEEDENTGLTSTVTHRNCSSVSVSWSSQNTSIAEVSGSGNSAVVTGKGEGQTGIVASAQDADGTFAEASASITVTRGPVGSVSISPPASTLQAGQTLNLSADVRSTRNRQLTNRPVQWSSSNAGVATIAGSGTQATVTGMTVGTAVITATSEGRNASATVQVTAAPPAQVMVTPSTPQVTRGQTLALQADVRDAAGNTVTNAAVTWSSANAAVASVSGSGTNATVTGNQVGGPVRITATAGSASGFADVTVTDVPVATVTVQPGTGNVSVGATLVITATTRDGSGNVLTGRSINWASTDASVATVAAIVATRVPSSRVNSTRSDSTRASRVR
jgi:uncharacterized protein YjdB